jgi:hypothetical protein
MVSKPGHCLYRLIATVTMCMFRSTFEGGKIDSRGVELVLIWHVWFFSIRVNFVIIDSNLKLEFEAFASTINF